MKTRLKKGLYGLTLSLIAVFMLSQISFGEDISEIQKGSASEINQGDMKIGIGRIRISDNESKNRAFNATSSTGKKVIVYAAFTSGIEASIDGEDLPAYLPVLDKKAAYMYLAFRVTKKTTVDIKWNISGQVNIEKIENGFEDPVDGGPLLPGYWYFVWFKLDPLGLVIGTYDFDGKVKPSSLEWADGGSDSCKFQIVK